MLLSFSIQIIAIAAGVIVSIITVDTLGAFSLPQPLPPVPRIRVVQVIAARPNSTGRTSGIQAPVRPVFVPNVIPTSVARIVDQPTMTMADAPTIGPNGGVVVLPDGVDAGPIGSPQPIPVAAPPAAAPPPEKREQTKVRVGGDVLEAKMIKRVIPVYPPLARQARISGTVKLQGVISREGRVVNLQVLSGHPLLVSAALEAVRQWIYQPTLLNKQPVEVIAPIDVHFNLSQP